MKSVFISHSSKDKVAADQLVIELEQRNLKCWIAPRDIAPSADYAASILNAIEASYCVLVLVSEASVESRHVRSEVARASSLGKPIYPVRLVDIQVAGGLQFFIELSQWIDLFPEPDQSSYDALAQALKTGAKKTHGPVRFGLDDKKIKKMAILGVLGVGLTLFAMMFLYEWFYMSIYMDDEFDAMNSQYEDPPDISELDINKNIELYEHEIGKYLINFERVKGISGYAEVEVSTDREFSQIVGQMDDYDPTRSYFLRIRQEYWNKQLGPYDITDAARASYKGQIIKKAEEASKAFECRMGYCHVQEYFICNAPWVAASLSDEKGEKTVSIDLSVCSKSPRRRPCVASPESMFPTVPGQQLVASVEAESGEIVQALINVDTKTNSPASDVLAGDYVGKSSDGTELTRSAPYAEVWFDYDANMRDDLIGIDFFAAACSGDNYGNTLKFKSIYFDMGEGGYQKRTNQSLSVPIPKKEYFDIILESNNGQRFGPYRYSIDLNKLLNNWLDQTTKPTQIRCEKSRSYQNYKTYFKNICRPLSNKKSIFEWAMVRSIEYGSEPGVLDKHLDIELPVQRILELYRLRHSKNLWNPDLPWKLELPNSQRRLFFKLNYKDGSTSVLQRLELEDPGPDPEPVVQEPMNQMPSTQKVQRRLRGNSSK